MTFLEAIIPGDKINIQQVSQQNMEENGEEAPKMYYSTVLDCLSETELEIAMPMEGARMILFSEGVQIDMIFFTRKGMYRCVARVTERYKKGNLYMLHIEMESKLEKFQRRDFFRMECCIDLKIFHITEEIAGYSTNEQLVQAAMEPEVEDTASAGTILDISGGGIRFTSQEHYQTGERLLYCFRLSNNRINQTFYIVGQIVSSEILKNNDKIFMNRSKFVYKDIKDRESIIQYIFEEERVLRQKLVGESYEKKYSGS